MTYTIPDNAIILEINDNYSIKKNYNYLEGLNIVTDKGNITLVISMDSQCCERYDALFLETPDNLANYIGATIFSVEDVCTSNACEPSDDYCSETQLKITTSKGVLQYAVYNAHNGYYSHATFLQVFDTQETGCL